MDWPLIYKDKSGVEKSIMHSDGFSLTTVIRGITFKGTDFDKIKPDKNVDSLMLKSFTLNHGDLCNCIFECFIEIPIIRNERIVNSQLKVVLELGNEKPNGALDKENLSLSLHYNGETIIISGAGYFEDALLEIQKQLPEGTFIKACISCAYSDYSPYGSGLFGTMMCFRNIKKEYLQVKSKDDLFEIHDRYDNLVQETFCCDDFQKRISGTGYRG